MNSLTSRERKGELAHANSPGRAVIMHKGVRAFYEKFVHFDILTFSFVCGIIYMSRGKGSNPLWQKGIIKNENERSKSNP